jgi:predicted Zn-dependent protease
MEGLMSGIMQSDTDLGHAARVVGKSADAFRKIPFTEEQEYGRALTAQTFHAYGLFRAPEIEAYLNLVANTVAACSDRPSIKYYVAILNDNELNALSAPGGYIFVTWRILLTLEDEAELAGVLGHEIGHIAEKHVLDTMQNVKKKEALMEAVTGGDQNAFNGLIDGMMDGTFGAPFSRHQEVNCDRLGGVFIAKAGYDNEGMARALLRLKEVGAAKPGRYYGSLVERADESLKYQKEKGKGKVQTGGVKLTERYQKMCIEPLKAALTSQKIKF